MHKVLVRFLLVKNREVIETNLDERLSFKENLAILDKLLNLNIKECLVYDDSKKLFLDKNIPISNFKINYFVCFYLY